MRLAAVTTILILAISAQLFTCAKQSSAVEPAAAAKEVTIDIASWEETQQRVAAHKGKIVVLDAWSTSCQPCMKEFPHLVELHKRLGGKGVVCMSMSCDYAGIKNKPPEFYKERVLKFLTKQDATFENILCNVPSDELFDQMKLSSIPAVYVFGKDGKLAKRFDNEKAEKEEDNFTYDDVTKLVEELLKKK